MTLVQYAEYFGSVYTRAFAAKHRGHASVDDGTVTDAQAADAFLRERAYVLLDRDFRAQTHPFAGLAEWMGDPLSSRLASLQAQHLNAFASLDGELVQKHGDVIDQKVLDALADDIWLYRQALARPRAPRAQTFDSSTRARCLDSWLMVRRSDSNTAQTTYSMC